jgi:hypothetical protein
MFRWVDGVVANLLLLTHQEADGKASDKESRHPFYYLVTLQPEARKESVEIARHRTTLGIIIERLAGRSETVIALDYPDRRHPAQEEVVFR